MRSRSEARFARWCDDHHLKWVYEPEAFASNGMAYLPDFLLPEIRCLVEVKPPAFIDECSKMYPILDSPETFGWTFLVVAMEPDLRLLQFWEEWAPDGCPGLKRSEASDWEGNFVMEWCVNCMKPILCSWGSWRCRHCGTYDGNGHLRSEYDPRPLIVREPPPGSP